MQLPASNKVDRNSTRNASSRDSFGQCLHSLRVTLFVCLKCMPCPLHLAFPPCVLFVFVSRFVFGFFSHCTSWLSATPTALLPFPDRANVVYAMCCMSSLIGSIFQYLLRIFACSIVGSAAPLASLLAALPIGCATTLTRSSLILYLCKSLRTTPLWDLLPTQRVDAYPRTEDAPSCPTPKPCCSLSITALGAGAPPTCCPTPPPSPPPLPLSVACPDSEAKQEVWLQCTCYFQSMSPETNTATRGAGWVPPSPLAIAATASCTVPGGLIHW